MFTLILATDDVVILHVQFLLLGYPKLDSSQSLHMHLGPVLSNFVANIVIYENSTVLEFSFQFYLILSSDISSETPFQDVSNDMSHDRIR